MSDPQHSSPEKTLPQTSNPNPLAVAVVSVVLFFGMSAVVQLGLNAFLRDVTYGRVHVSYMGAFGLLTSLYVVARIFATAFVSELATRVADVLRAGIAFSPLSSLPKAPSDEKESDR